MSRILNLILIAIIILLPGIGSATEPIGEPVSWTTESYRAYAYNRYAGGEVEAFGPPLPVSASKGGHARSSITESDMQVSATTGGSADYSDAIAEFTGTYTASSASFIFSYKYITYDNSKGWIIVKDLSDSTTLFETNTPSGTQTVTVNTPVGHTIEVNFGINTYGSRGENYARLDYQMGVSFDDNDGDGYTEDAGDCDDSNPDINPGMTEVPYNGIDDDCNPATADDDLDNDGFINSEDCNDSDPSFNPDAMEIKHDGIDQDCNGYDLTIDIISSKYNYSRDELTVEATSALKGDADLYLEGFGDMKFRGSQWKTTIMQPVGNVKTITVCGIEGCMSGTINLRRERLASNSVAAYDASGQFLGIFLGFNGDLMDIHMPLSDMNWSISSTTGDLESSTLYFDGANCSGNLYVSPTATYKAFKNGASYYIGDKVAPVALQNISHIHPNGYCISVTEEHSLVPAVEIIPPFSLPVALPISFKSE